MRLVIRRQYEPRKPGDQYHSPYRTHAQLELSDEEQDLVGRYGLGDHVLTRSKYRVTTLADAVKGTIDIVTSVDLAMGNEQVLRDACASLPAIFDYCRTFGQEVTVDSF